MVVVVDSVVVVDVAVAGKRTASFFALFGIAIVVLVATVLGMIAIDPTTETFAVWRR